MGLLVGAVVACYLLLIGYITRDARRRGMSPVLWTFVAILVPNALGIILYFILRHADPQCLPTMRELRPEWLQLLSALQP